MKNNEMKWLAIVIVIAALAVEIIPGLIFIVMMGSIGEETVIQTEDSPDGRYTAQLIQRDEGALGGSTFIEVKDNEKTYKFLFWEFESKEKCIYVGRWSEAFDMDMQWLDEDTLVTEGHRFEMEKELQKQFFFVCFF